MTRKQYRNRPPRPGQIRVYLPPSLYRTLKQYSLTYHISMAQAIRLLISRHLDNGEACS